MTGCKERNQLLSIENMLPGKSICDDGKNSGTPWKSGVVYVKETIRGRPRKLRVVLSVYKTNFESYAVISQDRCISKDYGYINLKNCSIDTSSVSDSNTFSILPRNSEGKCLSCSVSDVAEMEDWLQVLSDTTQQHHHSGGDALSTSPKLFQHGGRLAMPVLEESDEELSEET